PFPVAIEDSLFKEALDQRQDTAVLHLLADQGHQAVLRDRVEVAFQVGIDDVDVTGPEQFLQPPQRVLASPVGAKAVAVRRKVPLEDLSHPQPRRALPPPVASCWYPRRAHPRPPRLGDVAPAVLWRRVAPPPQLLAQAPQICVLVLRETFDRD